MHNKIKILIVEDEAIIAENLRFSLEDLGYEVAATCYTYREAVDALTTQVFDLAMLDINLGEEQEELNGFSLAKYINDSVNIPFVFLTAYSDANSVKSAARLQPYGYLVKPVNNASIFAAVQLAMERHISKHVAEKPGNNAEKPDYFFVKLGTKTVKVFWSDVYCLEAGKNYVKLRVRGAGHEYPIRGSLTYVVDNLLPAKLAADFIKVNRSVYLNRNYITAYDQHFIYVESERFENGKGVIKQLKEAVLK